MMHRYRLICGSLALLGCVLLAPPASAAPRHNVLLCEAGTRAAVIACCERVSGGRLPIWMQTSHTTCRSQAFCAPRHGRNVCRIAPAQDMVDLETLEND